MRVMLRGVAGGFLAAVAYAVSLFSGGPLGAASFLLAIFFATVTLGILVAALVNTRLERQRIGAAVRASSEGTCSSCSEAMVQTQAIWVCATCDLVTSRS